MIINKKQFSLAARIAIILWGCCLATPGHLSHPTTIQDISTLTSTPIHALYTPTSLAELSNLVFTCQKPISIAGLRASQGGHIAYPGGTVIDITSLNKIISLDVKNKKITVQAGATWREIQQHINPYGLSVKVMQSYNDFTIGGSLSVNIHGRDIHYGQLIETIEAITILLADGTLTRADRINNKDLFNAAIGGYGLLGIIVDATISLTTNTKLKRSIATMSIDDYSTFFMHTILPDKSATLHNAYLYPNKLQKVTSITWYNTNDQLTNPCQLYTYKVTDLKTKIIDQLLRRIPPIKKLRPSLEQIELSQKQVVWRNYEMSNSIQTLEPLTRKISTNILQEYFVPLNKLTDFIDQLRTTIKNDKINVINISIRYVPKNNESLLSYAPQDSFALVLYINIFNTKQAIKKAQKWTQKIIDAALACKGTYYLPYQLWATKKQLLKAYPHFEKIIKIKQYYDPDNTFSNNFFKKYYCLT